MDWAKFKLPIPVYQQEKDEKCLTFLRRIQTSLQSKNLMDKEEAVFWFLIGVREDIIPKIPFDPEVSLWIDPDVLEKQLENIDNGEKLNGPFRTNRLQNCFNYFVCFRCGNWGHKSVICRNHKPTQVLGRALKRKIVELYFDDETHPPKVKNTQNDQHPMTSSQQLPLSSPWSMNSFEDNKNEFSNNQDNYFSIMSEPRYRQF